MKMFKGQLFVFIIIYMRDSSCTLDAVYNAGKEVWKLYSIIGTIKSKIPDTVDGLPNDNAVMNEEIRKQTNEINKQLDQMEKFMHSKIIHDSLKSWPYSGTLYKCLDTLELYISNVDACYKDFRRHMNETSYPSKKVQEFMESFSSNIDDSIRMIRSYVLDANYLLPDHRNLIFAITGQTVLLQSQLCNTQILSHLLVQLFKMVIIAEIKGNVMISIGRTYHLPQTAGALSIYTKEQFESQLKIYVDVFSSNIPLADPVYVRACAPINNNWIRDESFYEFEGTFQTAIFHYNYINCIHDSCNNVLSKKAKQCAPQYYDDRSGCSRLATDCVYLEAARVCVLVRQYRRRRVKRARIISYALSIFSKKLHLRPLDSTVTIHNQYFESKQKSGAHKFQYVNSSELGLFGNDSKCPQDRGYIIQSELGWNSTQRVCACKCYENDNKIGLFMMKSRVESNMVITGIRFIRQDQMLYIQPKEGKLDADGRILPYSERWMHIPKDIPRSQIHPIDEQNKLFFFDDICLPAGFALIGVRFNQVKRGDLMGFAIKIYGVPFDYRSGKLDLVPESLVSMQARIENPREPLFFEAISSVYAHSTDTLSPTNKSYVSLKRSELEQDFGQSTLPLFDALPVTTHPSSVLGGIGIFHKGSEGYAGFISLRIYGVRHAKYFTNSMSTYMP